MPQGNSSRSRRDLAQTVYRPLGLTIAILATGVFYGLMPLLEVYFLRRLDATAEEAYILGGVDTTTWTTVQGIIGGAILVVCVLAWIGRPPWIRWVLIGAILVPTAISLFRVFEAWTDPINPITGGQAQETVQGFLRCQGPLLILVPLYVLWYLNRAPSRAFYRRIPLRELVAQETAARASQPHSADN